MLIEKNVGIILKGPNILLESCSHLRCDIIRLCATYKYILDFLKNLKCKIAHIKFHIHQTCYGSRTSAT